MERRDLLRQPAVRTLEFARWAVQARQRKAKEAERHQQLSKALFQVCGSLFDKDPHRIYLRGKEEIIDLPNDDDGRLHLARRPGSRLDTGCYFLHWRNDAFLHDRNSLRAKVQTVRVTNERVDLLAREIRTDDVLNWSDNPSFDFRKLDGGELEHLLAEMPKYLGSD